MIGGGPGGWFGNWIGWGRGTRIKDIMEAKPRAAVLETEAALGQRLQDIKGALSDPVVAKMIKRENIVRIAVLISGAVFVFLYFFVLMWLA